MQSLAAVITNSFLIYIIIWILMARLPNIPVLLLVLAAQEGMIVLWAYLSHRGIFTHTRLEVPSSSMMRWTVWTG